MLSTKKPMPPPALSAAQRRTDEELKAARKALAAAMDGLPMPESVIGHLDYGGNHKPRATFIMAPRALSLSDARDQFLGLIYKYRWMSFVSGPQGPMRFRQIVIDLVNTYEMSLAAALVLTSEYHRGLLLSNFKPTIFDAKWPENIRSLLQMLGFYELVKARDGPPTVELAPSPTAARFVRFRSGEMIDATVAGEFVTSLQDAAGRDPEYAYTYAALVEAIGNVKGHAYPPDQPKQVFPIVPQWWTAGSYDPGEQVLKFVVYDQGVGIAATLPKRPFFRSLLRLCPVEFNDADVIEGAIRYGRTRHRSSLAKGEAGEGQGRGNGLWTICRMIPDLKGSSVRIMSGRGEVIFSGRRTFRKTLHAKPFCGTLIEWTLKLPHSSPGEGADA